tara:strand:+ start:3997 stop:4686 length:690 start_codon:yes stop_codon:yes gene_type:complete
MEMENENYQSKIALVIPIKLNNERLPGKTFLPLHYKPLCEYTFDRCVEFKIYMKNNFNINIDLYVYCSDDEICNWLPNPHITFVQRPKLLDDNNILMNQVLSSFEDTIKADWYLVQFITCPYLKVSSMVNAFMQMIDCGFDSIYSIQKISSFVDYDNHPLNYNPRAVERTQDIKHIEIHSNSFYFMSKNVIKMGRRTGHSPASYIVSDIEAIDIDTESDLLFANMIKIP